MTFSRAILAASLLAGTSLVATPVLADDHAADESANAPSKHFTGDDLFSGTIKTYDVNPYINTKTMLKNY